MIMNDQQDDEEVVLLTPKASNTVRNTSEAAVKQRPRETYSTLGTIGILAIRND